ncbi:hypothetical protein P3S68_020586 [Capsicum galapagoense]
MKTTLREVDKGPKIEMKKMKVRKKRNWRVRKRNRTTLYGFPWAFMAWAFEAIPPLRKQLMDYPDEVSNPRMFRWLAAKSNTNI